jgi:hypothetical protein
MELVFTQADLDAMPADLRRQLFLYLVGTRATERRDKGESALLSREHAIALLREISFHHAGAHLRVLLDRLAYGDAAQPPTKKRLIEVLEEDKAHLGRYLATLNRLTAQVTGRAGAKLFEYHKMADIYTVPAATRDILRELLLTMKVSGKGEEPLWE